MWAQSIDRVMNAGSEWNRPLLVNHGLPVLADREGTKVEDRAPFAAIESVLDAGGGPVPAVPVSGRGGAAHRMSRVLYASSLRSA